MGLVYFRLRIVSLGRRSATTPSSFGFTQTKKPCVHFCVNVFVWYKPKTSPGSLTIAAIAFSFIRIVVSVPVE